VTGVGVRVPSELATGVGGVLKVKVKVKSLFN